VCEKERQVDRVREELLAHLKREQVEPPSRDRIRRIIGTALRQAEQALTSRIASRVPAKAVGRMRALIARAADPGDEEEAVPGEAGALFGAAEVTGVDVFAAIRDEPGNVSVKTIGQEAFKLSAIRAVGLPDDLFADVAPKVLADWRARVAAEAPSHLRSHPPEVMVTLLAAYLYCPWSRRSRRSSGTRPTCPARSSATRRASASRSTGSSRPSGRSWRSRQDRGVSDLERWCKGRRCGAAARRSSRHWTRWRRSWH